ncbi:hypothetical protein ThvES_00017510 [Thiovulum sp. ES]|nr:hypothetical protein ThvES_00017510 [Thiovulum sp. ES]
MRNIFLNSIVLSSLIFVGCSSGFNDDVIPDRNETEVVESPEVNETEVIESPEINETEVIESPEINETVNTKTTLSIPLCDEVLSLESGDKIQKISENPQIEIQHLANGEKSICVKSGEAQVERLSK